jgi:hypothetical protein
VYKNTSDSGKHLFFGVSINDYLYKNQDNKNDISPIGEHMTDDEDSSNFNNFGPEKIKDYIPMMTFKDAVEQQSNLESIEENEPADSPPFKIIINAPTLFKEAGDKILKRPTSSFNIMHNESSSSDIDQRLGFCLFLLNLN